MEERTEPPHQPVHKGWIVDCNTDLDHPAPLKPNSIVADRPFEADGSAPTRLLRLARRAGPPCYVPAGAAPVDRAQHPHITRPRQRGEPHMRVVADLDLELPRRG